MECKQGTVFRNGTNPGTYQGSAAEEDHKDDEGLKPVVFNDLEAGFPKVPPYFPFVSCNVNIKEGKPLHTSWRREARRHTLTPNLG